MENLLAELGLSPKEISIYRYLLSAPHKTAAEVAKHVKETRTNTYMLLSKLIDKGVVIADDSATVRTYSVANPKTLQVMLKEQQQTLARTRQSLETFMPDLLATYSLSQQRPGVLYLEGYEGLKASFEDQSKSKTDLLLWGSDIANRDPKVWQLIEKGGYQRRAKGIRTKALFHTKAANWPHVHEFVNKGFEIRLWGEKPFLGEVLIYDDKVTITAYVPNLIVTILTNDIIADTFRAIFNNCWDVAAELDLHAVQD